MKNIRFITAALLLTLPLIQGCSDDNAEPIASHVKVKLVNTGCNGVLLKILDQRYSAWEEAYACGVMGCEYAVWVQQSAVNWEKLTKGQEYYVDMKRIASSSKLVCDLYPSPPQAPVAVLRVY